MNRTAGNSVRPARTDLLAGSSCRNVLESHTTAMTKKHRTSRRSVWKLLIIVTIGVCIIGLLIITKLTPQLPSPAPTRRISSQFYTGNPKIAFLFLARRHLPLDFLWQAFFENAVLANFSIYIHSDPGFVFDESSTRSAFFYNRQLSNSIKVGWGESSMIQAERLLLGAALEDPANRRFILLSDSCVPLYNFSYIYEYLMASPKSFVDSFLDKKEGRYNPKMSPVIPKSKWRKGSQWIALVREHAEVVADDEIILPVFRKFCKRRPPVDVGKGRLNSARHVYKSYRQIQVIWTFWKAYNVIKKIQKQHNCIPDEHYVQTLLAVNLRGEQSLTLRGINLRQKWKQKAGIHLHLAMQMLDQNKCRR
ncbi:glycosyltransferase BC10-like isoform X3 [Apium graveolens]|uniref:glycosyltransferase BC10-like isoform X3 n=1 Tax=Apium graveolens TaxID=4045 RepID=UPI003D79FDA4